MSEQTDQRGMRRRADKLRFISVANLLLCVAVGIFSEIGEAAVRWTALVAWSVLLLVVCNVRATQMDKQGPIRRRQKQERS
jgi:hypothetical protein